MFGAVIGDIVGSRFEFYPHKSKSFELFTPSCMATDDSMMTIAIAKAILSCDGAYENLSEMAVACMQTIGRAYPYAGYGGYFHRWLYLRDPKPYHSFGNGAAMRVSACAYAATSLEEAKLLSKKVTEVTHNHPEGLKGAEALTAAIYLAKTGKTIPEIRAHIREWYYALDFTLDGIRETYHFDVTCGGSVPQAIEAFLESTSFEDAVRNAISLGGDSDTLGAMAGSVAEAYYGIPQDIRIKAREFLDSELYAIVDAFEQKFGIRNEK